MFICHRDINCFIIERLINEHALVWNHVEGSNTLVNDGPAGYIMDNELHGDFTMVVSVDGVQPTNPYAGVCKAICFGCTMEQMNISQATRLLSLKLMEITGSKFINSIVELVLELTHLHF